MTKDELIDEIRTAYADAGRQRGLDEYDHDDRCLSFLTSDWFTSADDAAEALEYIGPYNAFDPADVGAMLREVEEIDDSALFAVGRECSPVIYIETGDGDAVREVVGPSTYDEAPTGPASPDELSVMGPDDASMGREYRVGSMLARENNDREDKETHTLCNHDEPPVAIDDWPTADPDRYVVRAWWD